MNWLALLFGLLVGALIALKFKKPRLSLGWTRRDKGKEVCVMLAQMRNTEIGTITVVALGKNDVVLGIELGSLVAEVVSGSGTVTVVDDSRVDVTPADNVVETMTVRGSVDADKGTGVVTLGFEVAIEIGEEMASKLGISFATRPKEI